VPVPETLSVPELTKSLGRTLKSRPPGRPLPPVTRPVLSSGLSNGDARPRPGTRFVPALKRGFVLVADPKGSARVPVVTTLGANGQRKVVSLKYAAHHPVSLIRAAESVKIIPTYSNTIDI